MTETNTTEALITRAGELGNIQTEAEQDDALSLMAAVQKKLKLLEDRRKNENKPHNQAVKEINATYNPIIKRLEGVKNTLKNACWAYDQMVRRREEEKRIADAIRLEDVRKKQEEAAKKLRLAEEAAKKAEDEAKYVDFLANDSSGEAEVAATKEADDAAKAAEDARHQEQVARDAKAQADIAAARIDIPVEVNTGVTTVKRKVWEIEDWDAFFKWLDVRHAPDGDEYLRKVRGASEFDEWAKSVKAIITDATRSGVAVGGVRVVEVEEVRA